MVAFYYDYEQESDFSSKISNLTDQNTKITHLRTQGRCAKSKARLGFIGTLTP